MNNEYRIFRMRRDTAERLKVLAALRRQPMITVLDRIIADELDGDLWEASEEGKATIRATLDSPVSRTLTPANRRDTPDA